jgi:hypothetical protein
MTFSLTLATVAYASPLGLNSNRGVSVRRDVLLNSETEGE